MPYLRKRNSGRFLPAKNTRLVKIAQETTKNLERFNRENAVNAIAAVGYPVTIYVPLRQGCPCTCGNISKNILDEYGDMDRQTMESLLLDEDIEILPYTSDPSIPQDPAQQTGAQREYTVIGEQDYLDREQRQIDAGVAADLQKIDQSGEDIILRDNQTCAICFGTQIIGGYELVGGHRTVLEATTIYASSMVEHNATDRPNSFTLLNTGSSVTWQSSLPKGGAFALMPVLYNNRVVVDPSLYSISIGGSDITTVAEVLTACTGQLSTIMVSNLTDEPLIATHLEFVVYFSTTLMHADFPSIDKMIDITRADPISSVSVTIGGNLWLPKNTVVIDHLPKVSRHWKASNSTPRRSQVTGGIYDTLLETRNLDPYELTGMLRPLRQEIPPKSY